MGQALRATALPGVADSVPPRSAPSLCTLTLRAPIPACSYDNGTSVAGKRDNWAQLARAFARRGIVPGGRPLSRLEVEELVNCVPDTTLDFVTRLYATLTGRRYVRTVEGRPVARRW